MTLSFTELAALVALMTSAYALYNSIKKAGANKMKSEKEYEALSSDVTELKTRLAVAEACNTKNDKTIGEMKIDIDWIKAGIKEIKELLQKRNE